VGTIQTGACVDSKRTWAARWAWLDKIPSFDRYHAMDECRLRAELSIGLLRPRNVRLEIRKARHQDWTPEERAKLMQRVQGGLFDEVESRNQVRALQKIPFDFRYVYDTAGPNGDEAHRHKIVDATRKTPRTCTPTRFSCQPARRKGPADEIAELVNPLAWTPQQPTPRPEAAELSSWLLSRS
jgi:hypothetical protein